MSSLGATDTTLPALTQGVAQLEVAKPSTPREIQIPFVQHITANHDFTLPLDKGKVSVLTEVYESVKFVSLSFSVEITGQAGRLYFAATEDDELPVKEIDWLGATVYQRFSGNAHGDTYAEYRFPSTHPFGHELKATVLGNEHPRFYFRFKGTSGDTASIRGSLVLHGGGHGIIKPVALTEATPTK